MSMVTAEPWGWFGTGLGAVGWDSMCTRWVVSTIQLPSTLTVPEVSF